ncbi:hypothetical protein [Pontibacter oryzae]|uniref:Uncharacterized protein n=1 Tax=Pontibacter oryzae TaxID=2304593 RepID=A0A399SIX8_9BACT|nr:hypothetical protein [Pontibacter oryzae]RIJ42443.1 hypothetical protein D1627_00805 [Pontibacter oryzae]
MENLIAYLNESLVPLEEKVKAYLQVEQDIRHLEVEILTHRKNNAAEASAKEEDLNGLLQKYNKLREEVVQMLPEQNKFIEINLGYGPSMVGYFTVDHETHQTLPEPVLRVVH